MAYGPFQGAVEVHSGGLPPWLAPVARAAETVEPTQLSRFLPPEDGAGRQSAVLVLFGEGRRGPELLLMERAGSLRSHAGQPSFPGGALDPADGDPHGEGPVRAALREAWEETGLDPHGVQIFGVLPKLYIPVSGFVVAPVLGWWREPSPVGVMDPAETARVFTVPVADLTDPEKRATAVHPAGTAVRPSSWSPLSSGASPPVSSTGCSTTRAGSARGTTPDRSRSTGARDPGCARADPGRPRADPCVTRWATVRCATGAPAGPATARKWRTARQCEA